MTALSDRNSTGLCHWISALLLLIFFQMLISLLVFGGEFICSSEIAISPFHFCLIQHGEKFCDVWQGPNSDIKVDIVTAVIIVSLYAPLLFVAFALLSTLFAAYGRDGLLLCLSGALQAASSLLILTGVIAFLVLNQSYLSWKHMTIWFYSCCGVHSELIVVTLLTFVSTKKLNSVYNPNFEPLAEMPWTRSATNGLLTFGFNFSGILNPLKICLLKCCKCETNVDSRVSGNNINGQ